MSTLQMIADDLRDPRHRWGTIWRLCVCPITAPLLMTACVSYGLFTLIAHGEWRTPQ